MTQQEVPKRLVPRERLEFIEFRLLWEGQVNRSDLRARFGTSLSQASTDLRRYQDLTDGGVAYDVQAKRYVPTAGFRPRLLDWSAESYLTQLALVRAPHPVVSTWISQAPSFEPVPRGRPPIFVDVLRGLLSTI